MTDPREALVETIRGALLSNAGHRLPPEQVVADAILAAGWMPPVEGQQPGCTGAGDCPATAHTHGCYADTKGHCEHPEEHGWTPPTVKPSVEDVARALAELNEDTDWEGGVESYLPDARAVLALLPGRTEAEVKAEELRVAATVTPGGPRVSAWLRERADQWEETDHV